MSIGLIILGVVVLIFPVLFLLHVLGFFVCETLGNNWNDLVWPVALGLIIGGIYALLYGFGVL